MKKLFAGLVALTATAAFAPQAEAIFHPTMARCLRALEKQSKGPAREAWEAAKSLLQNQYKAIRGFAKGKLRSLGNTVLNGYANSVKAAVCQLLRRAVAAGKGAFILIQKRINEALQKARAKLLPKNKQGFFGLFQGLKDTAAKGWELVQGIVRGTATRTPGQIRSLWGQARSSLAKAAQALREARSGKVPTKESAPTK